MKFTKSFNMMKVTHQTKYHTIQKYYQALIAYLHVFILISYTMQKLPKYLKTSMLINQFQYLNNSKHSFKK